MTTAVSERVVQNRTLSQIAQVHHEVGWIAIGPICFDETFGIALPCGVQQRMKCIAVGVFAQVQLIISVEGFDACHEPMIGIAHFNCVRLDRWVSNELTTQRVGP